jgi:YVTN family beta-propeller protein
MYRLTVVLSFLFLAAAATGQQLERTIWLPDSITGARSPRVMALDSAHNRVFAGGFYGGRVLVLDAGTGEKLSVINLATNSPLDALYYRPAFDQLCCLTGDSILVVDATSGVVVARADLPYAADSLCAAPAGNRLFVYDYAGVRVSVFDCDSQAFIFQPSVRTDVIAMCASAAVNRVYTCSNPPVAIDCSTLDTVSIPHVGRTRSVCSSPTGDRVYFASTDSDRVFVVDCATDSVIARIPVGTNPQLIRAARATGKVYVGDNTGHTIRVIDPASLTVVATISTLGDPALLCERPGTGDIYAFSGTNSSSVLAIDGATNMTRGQATVATYPRAVCWDSTGRRIDWVGSIGSRLVRADTDLTVIGSTLFGYWPTSLMTSPASGQCAFRGYGYDSLLLVDDVTSAPRPLAGGVAGTGVTFGYSSDGAWLYQLAPGDMPYLHIIDAVAETARVSLLMDSDLSYGMTVTPNPVARASGLWGTDGFTVIDDAHEGISGMSRFEDDVNAVAADPRTGEWYLAIYQRASLLVLDGLTGQLIDTTASVEENVEQILIDTAGGRVYAVDRLYGVYVLDAATHEVLGIVDSISGSYRYVAFDPLWRRLYVAGGDSVFVYDCAAETALAWLKPGASVCGLLVDPERNCCYVMTALSLFTYDADSLTVLGSAALRTGWSSVSINHVHDRLYVACYEPSCIDVFTRPARDAGAGIGAERPRMAGIARGSLLLPPGDEAWLLDAAGRRVARLWPGPNDVRGLASGVYFVVQPGSGRGRKVLITR